MIIVVDGTDGTGKQTQTMLLFEWLKNMGKNVIKQSFPNYESESSFFVKKYLNGDFGDIDALTPFQASTFFALDRFLTMKKYEEFLFNDGILILDRYVSSNLIHQASKIKDEKSRENFVRELEHFEFDNLNLLKPDVTIFLDLKPDIAKRLREKREILKAGTKQDIHEKNFEYMKNCYEIGIEMAKKNNWEIVKCFDDDNILTVDEIQNKIQIVVEKFIEK